MEFQYIFGPGIMIQQRMFHMAGGTPQIIVSQPSFTISWQRNSEDEFALNVTPDSMDWTTAIEDTGDGDTWAVCVPSTGTGDKPESDICIAAFEANATGLDRYCDIRFTDDASEAPDVVREVMQIANPV